GGSREGGRREGGGLQGEGIVVQAAAKVGGGGRKPRGWRKLNFSEGTWQAYRKVPAKKCDARYGRKFRLARWRRIWKRSASTSIRRTKSANRRARFSPSSRATAMGTAARRWPRRWRKPGRTGLALHARTRESRSARTASASRSWCCQVLCREKNRGSWSMT